MTSFAFGSGLRKIRDARLYRCAYNEDYLTRLLTRDDSLEIIIRELEDSTRITKTIALNKTPEQQAARFLLLIAHEVFMDGTTPPSCLGGWFTKIVDLVCAYHEGCYSKPISCPQPSTPRSSFIYFIEASGTQFIKIGYARSPKRLNNLQIGCPLPLKILATCPGGRKEERELHERFDYLRERGEWFRVDETLSSYIDSVSERQRQ